MIVGGGAPSSGRGDQGVIFSARPVLKLSRDTKVHEGKVGTEREQRDLPPVSAFEEEEEEEDDEDERLRTGRAVTHTRTCRRPVP
jgi:hypothetical protein